MTDGIVPNALIECTPSELDYDDYYIVLLKETSYNKTLENDPDEDFFPYILEGTILQKPENSQITRSDEEIVPVTHTIIGDGRHQINLYEFHKSSLRQLSVRDRIKILGAVAECGTEGEVELYMYQYSTIVKLPPSEETFFSLPIPEAASKRVGVGKRQVKCGIEVKLGTLSSFKDYTEADISIVNMNPDAGLRLLENDTGPLLNPWKMIGRLLENDTVAK